MIDIESSIFDVNNLVIEDICKYVQKNMMVYQKPLGAYGLYTFEDGQSMFQNDRRKLIQEKLSIMRKLNRKN